MEEIWKPVKGFEGRYEISNLGNIKGLRRSVKCPLNGSRIIQESIMNPSVDSNGYRILALSCGNKKKTTRLHRLLALHFIPNPENKPEVNHIDGNKLNNSLNNLEWVTHQENGMHAYKNGLTKPPVLKRVFGEDTTSAVLKEGQVIEIRNKFASGAYTQKELGNIYGITRSGIQAITRRKTWRHI